MTMASAKPKVSEAAFQRQVIQLAQMCGWRVAHFRAAQNARGHWRTPVAGDGAGWPDLVLVRGDRILYRELKTETGKPTPEQIAWGITLTTAGGDWAIWRPSDWPVIEQVLMRRIPQGAIESRDTP